MIAAYLIYFVWVMMAVESVRCGVWYDVPPILNPPKPRYHWKELE